MKFVLGGDEPSRPGPRRNRSAAANGFVREADPGILARIHRIEQHPMVPRPRELLRAPARDVDALR